MYRSHDPLGEGFTVKIARQSGDDATAHRRGRSDWFPGAEARRAQRAGVKCAAVRFGAAAKFT